MSNIGLERAVARWGVKVVRTKVGDRYVVEEMRKHGYTLGGEQSGHLVFLDHATTGDGTLAALQVLALMCRTKKPMSELKKIFEPVPQTLLNLVVKEKRELSALPEVQKRHQGGGEGAGQERARLRALLGHRVQGARAGRGHRREEEPPVRRRHRRRVEARAGVT